MAGLRITNALRQSSKHASLESTNRSAAVVGLALFWRSWNRASCFRRNRFSAASALRLRKTATQKLAQSETMISKATVSLESCRNRLRTSQSSHTYLTDFPAALNSCGPQVSDQTVGNILPRFGIDPAPKRGQQTSWADFIRAHIAVLAGIDFFTVEVLTWRGLATYHVLFFLHLKTRRVTPAGFTRHPTGVWMVQMGPQRSRRDRRRLAADAVCCTIGTQSSALPGQTEHAALPSESLWALKS
jgi:hypothetical protein